MTAKKAMLITFIATVLVIAAGLGGVQYVAPRALPWALSSARSEMRFVHLDQRVPPFFENVFSTADPKAGGFQHPDPFMQHRAQQFYPERLGIGPHDALGFRNQSVPQVADVITIGDSHTYGNNAALAENWPHQLARRLKAKRAAIYDMSAGGWSAPQYLALAEYALNFRPRVLVVAFYTGNDSIETLAAARHIERWRFLLDGIPDSDEPLISDRTRWSAALGKETVEFTPRLRLLANRRDGAAVKAGYAIMARVAGLIAQKGAAAGVRVIFTAIPTKETVYRDLIRARDVGAPKDYRRLVADEAANVAELRTSIEGSGGTFVDLVTPMTAAALRDSDLYPPEDGHPHANGYRLIADALAPAVAAALPDPPTGYVALSAAKDYPFYQVSPGIAGSARLVDQRAVFFIDDDGAWLVEKPEPSLRAVPVEYRDIATLPQRGFLRHRPP